MIGSMLSCLFNDWGISMSFKVVVLASALLISGSAFAETCDVLAQKLVEIDKSVDDVKVSGVGDNSAVRETNRLLQIGNLLQRKQYIFSVMQSQKCPVPKIAEYSFMRDASGCHIAMLSNRDGASKEVVQSKCDKAQWQPD